LFTRQAGCGIFSTALQAQASLIREQKKYKTSFSASFFFLSDFIDSIKELSKE